MALSKDFFLCGWNIFDLIIVSASLVDIIFELVDGLSVLRGLRLVSEKNLVDFIFISLTIHFSPVCSVKGIKVSSIVDYNESAS